MNCIDIQDMIATGYVDGEIKESLRREIEEHLKTCEQCKAFNGAVRGSAVDPLRGAGKNRPAEHVWRNIKHTIEAGQKRFNFSRVIDNLKGIVRAPRLAFALSSVAAILLLVIIFGKASIFGPNQANVYLNEQIEYLSYLRGDAGDIYENGYYEDMGTEIEKYFL